MSPLGRVLGWGSAKEGVEHWWAQRLTAVALVPLGIWLAVAFAGLEDFSYASVVGLALGSFAHGTAAIFAVLKLAFGG